MISILVLGGLVGCASTDALPRSDYDLLEGLAFRNRPAGPLAEAQRNIGLAEGEPASERDDATCAGKVERNEHAFDPAAAALGRRFFCEKLSGPLVADDPSDPVARPEGSVDTIGCDTCHHVEGGGADPRGTPKSFGAEGWSAHNAPTVLNAGFRGYYSWNYVCGAMWAQIRLPLMKGFHGLRNADCAVGGDPAPCVADRVRDAYGDLYEDAFGPIADDDGEVFDNVARSLDAYVRTLESGDSAFDRYLGASYEERDPSAMSAEALRGARLFVGKAACDGCHWGPMLSDGLPHDLGLANDEQVVAPDREPQGYQTPTLRDVARTAPYMHDGSLTTLEEVVWYYNDGGGSASGRKDATIAPLGLDDEEQRDLVAFLRALDGTLLGTPPSCAP